MPGNLWIPVPGYIGHNLWGFFPITNRHGIPFLICHSSPTLSSLSLSPFLSVILYLPLFLSLFNQALLVDDMQGEGSSTTPM